MAEKQSMVANPFHAELQRLRDQVGAAVPGIADAFDSSVRDLVQGDAWQGTGPARAFEQELTGRSSRLGGLIQAVLDEVDAKLATTDAQVPADQARGIHNILRAEGVR